MEKLNFTDKEKELLNEMHQMYEEQGVIPLLDAISKSVEKQGWCIIGVDGNSSNMLYFFFKNEHNEEDNRKAVCRVYSILHFFKKIHDDGLVLPVVSMDITNMRFLGFSEQKRIAKGLLCRLNDEWLTIEDNTK